MLKDLRLQGSQDSRDRMVVALCVVAIILFSLQIELRTPSRRDGKQQLFKSDLHWGNFYYKGDI